jgi:hypothetical protein
MKHGAHMHIIGIYATRIDRIQKGTTYHIKVLLTEEHFARPWVTGFCTKGFAPSAPGHSLTNGGHAKVVQQAGNQLVLNGLRGLEIGGLGYEI